MQHLMKRNWSKLEVAMVAIVAGVMMSSVAQAGTTGTEFQALFTLLNGWITGYLGRGIAIAAFIMGVGASIMGRVGTALTGLGTAVIIFIIPTVINNLLSATF